MVFCPNVFLNNICLRESGMFDSGGSFEDSSAATGERNCLVSPDILDASRHWSVTLVAFQMM